MIKTIRHSVLLAASVSPRSDRNRRAPAPPNAVVARGELARLRGASAESGPRILEQIRYWDSGPPSCRWMDMIVKPQSNDRAGRTVGVRSATGAVDRCAVLRARKPRPGCLQSVITVTTSKIIGGALRLYKRERESDDANADGSAQTGA